MSTKAAGNSSGPASPAASKSQVESTATAREPVEADRHRGVGRPEHAREGGGRIARVDGGQHGIEDVRDADGVAGTDDLDRGLRQRRFPGSDRELR